MNWAGWNIELIFVFTEWKLQNIDKVLLFNLQECFLF